MLTSYYVPHVQRLIHDAAGSDYSTTRIVDAVNEARFVVAGDTGCLRSLQNLSLTVGQESYAFCSLPLGPNMSMVQDIVDLSIYLSGSSGPYIPLLYMPWSEFSAKVRAVWVGQGLPEAWTLYGQSTFYISPVPSSAYTLIADTVQLPGVLQNDTDAEAIAYPFYRLVEWYACHLLSLRDDPNLSATFLKAYQQKLVDVQGSVSTRRLSASSTIWQPERR